MKIYKKLDAGSCSVFENERADLRVNMEKAWSGRLSSHIGMPYVRLENGVVVLKSTFAREDVIWISYSGCCNVFVDLKDDGYGYCIDTFSGVELDDEDRGVIMERVELEMSGHQEFLQRQRHWFAEKYDVLHTINRMTPDEAVKYMASRGW